MKIIISPAKKLNFTTPINKPCSNTIAKFHKENPKLLALPFAKKTRLLVKQIKQLSEEEFASHFSLSKNLATLNHKRFQKITFNNSSANNSTTFSKEAIFSFDGDVYGGINASNLPTSALTFLANNLFIISGLYGLLHPFTKIQPYRLEMGKALPSKKSLYKFWEDSIANYIISKMHKGELLINLASQEYFKSIAPYIKKISTITPIFKDFPKTEKSLNNTLLNSQLVSKPKVIGFLAKRARGLFARFLMLNHTKLKKLSEKKSQQKITELLKTFNAEGYYFFEEKIKENAAQLIFYRNSK